MKTQLRKGFTLVEIMIVVVIIGLLAALAIPAFKKVRNNAIEKSLINDARQLSAAANQIASEQATTQVLFSEITKYISGGKLSTGVVVDKDGGQPTTETLATLSSANAYFVIGTAATPYFSLGHPTYDRTLSSQTSFTTQAGGGTTYLLFDTNDGKAK